jgi:hypothetical protein
VTRAHAAGHLAYSPRSRTLSTLAAIPRSASPALIFVLAAALPLRASAQDQGAPPVEGAADALPASEAEPPSQAQQPAAPAANPNSQPQQPPVEQTPAAPVPPSAQPEKEEEPPPPPSGEQPAPPPATVAPPIADPATATSATGSASPAAEVDEDERTKVPWIASLSWSHAYNAAGVSRSAFRTFNPEYAWSFNAVLGWRLDERTSVALSQALAIELTDSDITNSRQEPWLLDTAIDGKRELIDHEIDEDHSFGASGSIGVLLPTSKPSQAATMVFAGRGKLGAEYTVEDVLHGLSAGVSGSYTHRFLRSNVVEADAPFPCVTADLQDTSDSCSHLGSLTNTRDLFVLGVDANLGLTEQLTLGAQVSFGWNLAASLGDEDVMLPTGTVVRVGDDSLTHWRNSRVIGISLEYAFTDWFSGATLFTNSFAERSSDGQYRAPFNGQDMVLGLELSVSFDQLYEDTRGHAAGD